MNKDIFFKYVFLFIIGGFSYFYIEILFRGFSHYSMIICGGLAFVLCGLLNRINHIYLSIIDQMVISSIIITLLELITGYIVNIKLHWHVWDYSGLPYNFHGQICAAYSFIWLILSFICIIMNGLIRWKVFDEEKPKYKII